MSELRTDVRIAVLQALCAIPEPLRAFPEDYIEDVVTAVMGAIRGPLLADLGKVSAAATSLEIQIMDDCQPPDMGIPAEVS
jgi:hypothetical protein